MSQAQSPSDLSLQQNLEASGEQRSTSPSPPSPQRATGDSVPTPAEDSLDYSEIIEHWLHLSWRIGAKTQARAASTMGREIHRHQNVLRVFVIEDGESAPISKTLIQQTEITVGCQEWLVRTPGKACTMQIEIGKTFGKGRYFCLINSGPIQYVPRRNSLQRDAGLLAITPLDGALDPTAPPPLQVNGFLLLQGITAPRAEVLIDDQKVDVDSNSGSFEWKIPLLNGRVVVPVSSHFSRQYRRAILAVEANFHLLDAEQSFDD